MDTKLPPHSIDAEHATLGSILIDSECLSEIDLQAEDFHDERARWTYEAMLKLGEASNQITVAQELARAGHLEGVGGVSFLSQVVSVVPTSIHAGYYADIVRQCAYRRRLIQAAGQIAAQAYEGNGDSTTLQTRAVETLIRLAPQEHNDIVEPEEHAKRMLEMVSSRRQGKQKVLKFGYLDLDRALGGMYGGNLIIVGARPMVGKSQWMQEVALHNCHKSVLIASAEMSLGDYDERDIAMSTGISIERQRTGQLTGEEWEAIQQLVAEVSGRKLYFLEGKVSTDSITRKASLLRETKGLDLVVVDYLHLLREGIDRKFGENRNERIGYITSNLKALARDLGVPVMAASQLNRGLEGREDKRPTLADLRDSGNIEQDADIVLLLHRPELFNPIKEKGILYVYIAKSRQIGKTGVVKLVWSEREHRYKDLANEDSPY